MEHGRLAFELPDRPIDERLLQHHGRIVGEVAGGEVVAAVHDDVELLEDAERVLGGEVLPELDHLHVGVEGLEGQAGRFGLRHPDPVVGVEDLTLQIREVDHVHVDDADRADPRRREVEGHRRPEPPRADAQNLGVEELRLPRLTYLGQEKVAAVADLLLGRELSLLGDRETLVLPAREAPPHRDDVRVAELLQDAPREQGPRSAAAVGHDRRVLCRHRLFDPHLEEAARQGNGAGHEALAEFLPLTYVEQHRPLATVEASLHVVGRHFGHELPCLLHHLLVRLRHRSALGPVEEVHPILEPAPHGPRVTRIDEQAHDAQYAPHRILTREGERVLAEAEEVNELLTIDAPEQSAAPEREQDHVRTGFAGDGCTIPSSSSR